MKQALLLLLAALVGHLVWSQDEPSEPVKTGDHFFFGLSYNYLDTDMKLLGMTMQSVWANEDYGTMELSGEEIDSINSFMDYSERFHDVSLVVGAVLLNKPDHQWYIDGNIAVGFNRRENTIMNTDNDTTDVKLMSEHNSPSFGLGLNFKYQLNDRWSLGLGVNTLFAFSKSNVIDENIFPNVDFMEEERENKFRISYTTAHLLASYKVKDLTIGVGPGFYFLHNRNEYHIIRTHMENGTTYEDTIETKLRSDMFVNGRLQVGWRITDHLLINAGVGAGKDISANAGLLFFL